MINCELSSKNFFQIDDYLDLFTLDIPGLSVLQGLVTSNISTKFQCLECGYEWNTEQKTQIYAATLPIDPNQEKSGSLCKQLEKHFSSTTTSASCCMKCHERKKSNTGMPAQGYNRVLS